MSPFAELSPPYATIVADPPWPYPEGFAGGHSGSRTNPNLPPTKVVAKPLPYSSMCVDAIKALPVSGLAARDCRLFLWATNRYLIAALDVLAAWGFTYRQTLVWHKPFVNMPASVAPNSAVFADLIEQSSLGPYVELFARAPRLGWDSWGYGYEAAARAVTGGE